MIPSEPGTQSTGGLKVQDNGLPEGVTILPANAQPDSGSTAPAPTQDKAPKDEPRPKDSGNQEAPDQSQVIVKPRARIADPSPEGKEKPKSAVRRKPGRPKAGRLDVPLVKHGVMPAAPPATTEAPAPAAAPATDAHQLIPETAPAPAVKRMSDISPRRPVASHKSIKTVHHKTEDKAVAAKTKKSKRRPSLHKVGVPPIHYGPIFSRAMHAHVEPGLLGWATLSAVGFGLAIGYGVWLLLTDGLPKLAHHLQVAGALPLSEILVLAALYYIGRSIGQTAITFGVIRDVDHRPVALARQFGVAINSFGRRLRLDLMFAFLNLGLIVAIALLVYAGGAAWPVNPQLQLVALFCAFLFLLYLMSALAISRGLAAVALTLTEEHVWQSVKLGWRLFSHRFELLSLRFLALAVELLLCAPLAAVAIVFIVSSPPGFHLAVSLAVALLAVVAGVLVGVGTASWWAALYRSIVLTDRPTEAVQLLASRQPGEARRGALSLVVSLATVLVCAALALPWLKFF